MRTKTPRSSAKKQSVARRRPLHKRILLHPFSIMVLLCAGVIIAGSTFQSLAASYDVTATVPAALPSGPATITQPSNTLHVTSPLLQVSGTCPNGNYMKLYRNAVFSGSAICSGNTFQVQASLQSGTNELQAKVYNVTNQEGPTSAPLTIYYDDTTAEQPPAPAEPSTALKIYNLDDDGYQQGRTLQTSGNPTITGWAPPYAAVTVTFHSDPVVCRAKADAQGVWSCTLDTSLPPGLHRVDITALTVEGKQLVFPAFHIKVVASRASLLVSPPPAPLQIITDYQYQSHYVGQPFSWNMALSGGKAPYSVHIDWGDDSSSTTNRVDTSAWTVTHAYPSAKTYTVAVTASDNKGATTTVQLSAVVRDTAPGLAAISYRGPLGSFMANLKHYLWIVWPVYIGVILMAFSYWLGEQELYLRMVRGRIANQHAGKRR